MPIPAGEEIRDLVNTIRLKQMLNSLTDTHGNTTPPAPAFSRRIKLSRQHNGNSPGCSPLCRPLCATLKQLHPHGTRPGTENLISQGQEITTQITAPPVPVEAFSWINVFNVKEHLLDDIPMTPMTKIPLDSGAVKGHP